MTPAEYERVRELFLAARELPPDERAAHLAETCGDETTRAEVAALLAADAEDGFLESPALGAILDGVGPETRESARAAAAARRESLSPGQHPERIGQYRILDILGEGGMGVVYRAEQDRPRRIVALKVIKPGVESRETLRRFEYEGQVLGWLQHPGIAQVYEAGTADTGQGPQPFFALELVHGEGLTDYAHKHRLGIRGRLELLAKVCDAVHHAHQKGVIHRDLKPGNILVDNRDQPKILDFGVARATDADLRPTTLETSVGQLLGTVRYMSPEQVAGASRELDTRSDVYALGVIAYELLTGRPPVDISGKTLPQALRAVSEEDAPPLGAVNRALRGDVATIVAKALEKDKTRRYQSASDLAADIRHYLADQPIMARPATSFYQLRKFARRNRPLVIAGTVAFVALCWGLVQVTWERNRAVAAELLARERAERAQAEADKALAVNQFFNRLLTLADPTQDGRDVRVVDLLQRAADSVTAELPGQPEVEAAVQNSVGTAYLNLGLYAEAVPFLQASLDTRAAVLGEDAPDTLVCMTNLAAAYDKLARWAEAEALVRRTLEVRRRQLGPENVRTLESMKNLGGVLQKQGKFDEAEALWSDALAIARRVLPEDHCTRLTIMNNLGQLLKQRGRPAEAEPLLRDSLALLRKSVGEDSQVTLTCASNLAGTLSAQGRFAEAEPLLRHVLAVRRSALGEHPTVYAAVSNLAMLLRDKGDLVEAERLAQEALTGFRQIVGPENRQTFVAWNNLASLMVERGRAAEAADEYTGLLEVAARVLPPEHYMVRVFRSGYGECLTALQRYEEAEALLLPVYEGLSTDVGARHQHTQRTVERIVALYEAWGRPEQAATWRARLNE
ncbi:MAG: serine/threonine-protein kinase [Phycisphaerae bacterium]|jgi:tetratricopeptide (TPR) repeat protein